MALSPQASRFVAVNELGRAIMWDVISGDQLLSFSDMPNTSDCGQGGVLFSSSGDTLSFADKNEAQILIARGSTQSR